MLNKIMRRTGLGFDFLALYALFCFCVVFPVWSNARAACYNYYDLGIYGQAVAQLHWGKLNPWVTGRQIHIFNDHFDPVILLATPFVKIFGAAQALIVVEGAAVLIATLPLLYLHANRRIPRQNCLLAVGILLFHPCVVLALRWPAHPTTWAVAPAVFLGTAMFIERYRVACVCFVALLCCKEEFIYLGPPLALWMMARQRRASAATVGAITVLWGLWIYIGRQALLGPTMNYTQMFLADIAADPWNAFVNRLRAANLPFDLVSLASIFGILGAWAFFAGEPLMTGAFALCIPLLGIRFVAKTWGFHYNAVTVGLFVAAGLPALCRRAVPASAMAAIAALLVFLNGHTFAAQWPYKPAVTMAPFDYCPKDPERMASLSRAFELSLTDPLPLLVEQNLMPAISSHPQLYMFNGPQGADRVYHAVLFEKPPHGVVWQYTHEMVAKQLEHWRSQPDTEVIVDDAFVFYARGRFMAPPNSE